MALRKLKKYKPTKFKAKTSHYDKDSADFAVSFIESVYAASIATAARTFCPRLPVIAHGRCPVKYDIPQLCHPKTQQTQVNTTLGACFWLILM